MDKAVRNRKIERMMPDGAEKRRGGFLKVVLVLAIITGVGVGGFFACDAMLRVVAEGKRTAEMKTKLEARAKIEVEERVEQEKIVQRMAELEKIRQERIKTQKLVALTFDDGPSVETTPRLLDILRDKGVKATFFILGYMVENAPAIAQREIAEGHEVGSHTTRHINLNRVNSAEEVQGEMAAMREIMVRTIGKEPEIMRPPYGNGIRRAIVTENVGLPMIYWSVDPRDWEVKDAEIVRARVLQDSYDGAIILLHDVHSSTVDAVEPIIDGLREQGYEFVTISELAAIRGVEMQAGQVYFYFKP